MTTAQKRVSQEAVEFSGISKVHTSSLVGTDSIASQGTIDRQNLRRYPVIDQHALTQGLRLRVHRANGWPRKLPRRMSNRLRVQCLLLTVAKAKMAIAPEEGKGHN